MLSSSKISAIDPTRASELMPFSPSYNLYLKPIARVSITVQLPTLHDSSGRAKSFTTWEIIQKLRQLSPSLLSPPTIIKVNRTTLEWVRFIVDLDSKLDVKRLNTSLDSQTIKLSGFPQNLRVRACEAPFDCPRRHDWESFFRDASDMDETKIGERPDTIHLSGLPIRWFADPSAAQTQTQPTVEDPSFDQQPSPEILSNVFQTFGQVRRVDIPLIDPVQNPAYLFTYLRREGEIPMEDTTGINLEELVVSKSTKWEEAEPKKTNMDESGFGKIGPGSGNSVSDSTDSTNSQLIFQAYIQFVDYNGFSRAMEGLRGHMLVFLPPSTSTTKRSADSPSECSDKRTYFSAELKIDFNRTKHLSDPSVRSRVLRRSEIITSARRKVCEAIEHAEIVREQSRLRLEVAQKAEQRRLAEETAVRAERDARRKARVDRKHQKAIERCRLVKEALLKRKIHLEDCLHAAALRKVEAIRLMTILLRRVQDRHDAMVQHRRNVRECRAREVKQKKDLQVVIQPPHQEVEPKMLPDSTQSFPVAPSYGNSSTTHDKEAVLLEKLLQRREEALRQKLLQRRAQKPKSASSILR